MDALTEKYQIDNSIAAIRGRRWQEFRAGLIDVTPLLLGAMPFGLIYGVLAISAGLPTTMAQAMSSIVFAGSAQFITAQLIRDGAPLLVIIVTAAVLNLRHVLYSASLAPYLQHLNRGWKALLAYLLTDEMYAIAITRYWKGDGERESEADPRGQAASSQSASDQKHWYVFGVGIGLWVTWHISTAVGIFLGAQIPASWSLDFAMPLTFIAIVVPALRDHASVGTAIVAGGAALLALTLPLKLGLVTAMVVGIGTGYVVELVLSRSTKGVEG